MNLRIQQGGVGAAGKGTHLKSEEELTKLRMAMRRVMSRHSKTTNSLSTTRVATPRDSPDIH